MKTVLQINSSGCNTELNHPTATTINLASNKNPEAQIATLIR